MCECLVLKLCFFFQAEDGIRDAQESRGLGDVYKRQEGPVAPARPSSLYFQWAATPYSARRCMVWVRIWICLLYTSDAADDPPCVDLGGRRILKNKKQQYKLDTEHGQNLHVINATHRLTLAR